MTDKYLTPDTVFALLQSSETFPIDFDDAWRWLGYKRKDYAKDILVRGRFRKGVDYVIEFSGETRKKPARGRSRENIWLSIDCFKAFCMKAETDRGDEVRLYFIECERQLKARLEDERLRNKERVVRAIVGDEHNTWKKRFEDAFFQEAYRVTGWQPPSNGHLPCMAQFINEAVYDHFPDGTRDRLNAVNPRVGGKRKRKQHQHLTTTLGIPLLESQTTAAIAVMRLSPPNNRKQFRQNMHKALGKSVQIELPFMDDFDQVS